MISCWANEISSRKRSKSFYFNWSNHSQMWRRVFFLRNGFCALTSKHDRNSSASPRDFNKIFMSVFVGLTKKTHISFDESFFNQILDWWQFFFSFCRTYKSMHDLISPFICISLLIGKVGYFKKHKLIGNNKCRDVMKMTMSPSENKGKFSFQDL